MLISRALYTLVECLIHSFVLLFQESEATTFTFHLFIFTFSPFFIIRSLPFLTLLPYTDSETVLLSYYYFFPRLLFMQCHSRADEHESTKDTHSWFVSLIDRGQRNSILPTQTELPVLLAWTPSHGWLWNHWEDSSMNPDDWTQAFLLYLFWILNILSDYKW